MIGDAEKLFGTRRLRAMCMKHVNVAHRSMAGYRDTTVATPVVSGAHVGMAVVGVAVVGAHVGTAVVGVAVAAAHVGSAVGAPVGGLVSPRLVGTGVGAAAPKQR